MTKIKISYIKLYIVIAVVSLLDLLLTDSLGPDPKKNFLLIQVIIIIVFIASYFIQRKSSLGFYVDSKELIWRNGANQFHYPWDNVKIKVLIDLMSFTVVELSTDKNPKYRLLNIMACRAKRAR